MIHISSLKLNLICYWQIGGWHGENIVINFNSRFVYYKTFFSHTMKSNKAQIEEKIYRKSLSEFLKSHEVYNCLWFKICRENI
jgi:hypothetical protein